MLKVRNVKQCHHMSDDDSSSCDANGEFIEDADNEVPYHLWYRAQITEPFERACAYGDMDVVRSLVWNESNEPPPIEHPVQIGLTAACTHGHVQVVTWLLDNVPGLEVTEERFLEAFQNGHLDLVRMLWQRMEPVKPNMKFPLEFACQNDHANVVEWALQEDWARMLENPDWIAGALRRACIFGAEQLAHRLYDVLPDELREGVFQMADRCEMGLFTLVCVDLHLSIAQWLYTVAVVPGYINFRSDGTSDYLLFRVCVQDAAPVAHWLADRYADQGLPVPDRCAQYLQDGTPITDWF
jgi:hypothetical protein